MANSDLLNLLQDKLDIKELIKALGNNANVSLYNIEEIKKLLNSFQEVNDSLQDLQQAINNVPHDIQQIQNKQQNHQQLTQQEQDKLTAYTKEQNRLLTLQQQNLSKQRQIQSAFKRTTNTDINQSVIDTNRNFNNRSAKQTLTTSTLGKIGDIIGSIMTGATDIYVASLQKEQNLWMATQKQNMNHLEAQGKIMQRNIQLFGQTQQAVFGSIISQITQGANEGAFAAAQAMTDIAAANVSNMLQTQQDLLHMTNSNTLAIKEAEKENQKLTFQQIQSVMSVASTIASCVPGIGGIISQFAISLGKTVVDNYAKMATTENEIEYQRLQQNINLAEKQQEILNQTITSSVDIAKQLANSAVQFSQTIEKVVMNTEHAAKQMANFLGVGGTNVASFEKRFFDMAQNLIFKGNGEDIYLNKSYEDMMKMQQSYGDATGRNQVMTRSDYLKSFQLGTILGDDQLAGSLLGSMDYFNKSIADGTDLIYDMFQAANKAGISNRKFAKDLQQNLRLAQKYTFKEGVKGMMEMSLWSQKTRFNMASIESVIEKGLNGGLEGVIQQSAQLQVLGGNAAMLANPLAMMYEMGNDPASLMKRINDSIKGFGTFNSSTGEVDFAMNDALQLRAIASAYGLDATELRNQATQAIKNQRIDGQLNRAYTDEEKALIYNKATYQNGEWKVSVGGKYKSINDISGNDWLELKPTEEAIEDYVAHIYSILSKDEGVKVYSTARFAGETKESIQQEQNARIQNTLDIVNTPETREAMKTVIVEASQYVTEQQKIANEKLTSSTSELCKIFDLFVGQSKEAVKNITNSASTFNAALDACTAELNKDIVALKDAQDRMLAAQGALTLNTNASVNDGFASSQGHSMLMSASHITPINDGNVQLAKSHPQDSALFAKAGGPFDTLFNGIFTQINNIHSALFGSNGNNRPSNINLNMNGKISLDANGTSFDISGELKNNTMFVQAITQEIIIQMSKNLNGGKNMLFDYVKAI